MRRLRLVRPFRSNEDPAHLIDHSAITGISSHFISWSKSDAHSSLFLIMIISALIGCDEQRATNDPIVAGVETDMTVSEMSIGGVSAEGGTEVRDEAGIELGAGAEAGSEAGAEAGTEAGTEAGAEVPPPWIWPLEDDVEVQVTYSPFSLRLLHPHGDPLTLGDLGFGLVPELHPDLSYDPYWTYHEFLGASAPLPEGMVWASVDRLLSVEAISNSSDSEDQSWALKVLLSEGTVATLTLSRSSTSSILLSLSLDSEEDERDEPYAAFGYWEAPAREAENYYGLGESFDHVARRGTYRAMGFQPILEAESGYNEGHIPVPLLISTHGVGYFFETYKPSYFDVAYTDESVVRAEQSLPDPLKLHLIWSAHPFDALNTYYDLTARPLVPPYWSFAPHYWRNVTTGQAEVESDMQQMRDLKIPGGVFWIDRPYQNAYNDCKFDPDRYPDPEAMTLKYSALGYKMLLWHAPYTSEASDAWAEASEGQYFTEGPQFFTNFGRSMDFTHPEAVALWRRLLDRFNEYDVAGYKLDYGEDVQVGIRGRRLHFSFFDGSDELTMHHRYALLYHQTYLDSLPTHPPRTNGDNPHRVNGFILGRSSTFGGQGLAHALWPGDLDSDFHTHLEDDYWVGGLPSAVVAGLTLSASGFPFYGSDTGGFRNERPTQEVLTRWAWQTAFSAIMQIGGGGTSHFPWATSSESEPAYNERGVDWMREAAQWNIRLTDYRFTWGLNARKTGAPLLRPFGMAYPKDGRHPDDAYLLGPDLLVAPIISESSTRSVPIPEGTWLDYWTQEVTVGPADIERVVPLGSQALFLRSGAIIPLLDELTETLGEVINPETRSRAINPGPLTWVIVPGEVNEYLNHDGILAQLTPDTLTLTPHEDAPLAGEAALPAYSHYKVDLRFDSSLSAPSSLDLNGDDLSWVSDESTFNDCTGCLWSPSAGRVMINLPAHEGIPQSITWRD